MSGTEKDLSTSSSPPDDDSVKSDDSEQSLRSRSRASLLLKGAGQSFRKILGRGGVQKKRESIRDIQVAVAGGGKKAALGQRKTHLTRQARSLREIGTHKGKTVMTNPRNARSMRHVRGLGIKAPDDG